MFFMYDSLDRIDISDYFRGTQPRDILILTPPINSYSLNW